MSGQVSPPADLPRQFFRHIASIPCAVAAARTWADKRQGHYFAISPLKSKT